MTDKHWIATLPEQPSYVLRSQEEVDGWVGVGWIVTGPYVLADDVLKGLTRAEPEPDSPIYYKRPADIGGITAAIYPPDDPTPQHEEWQGKE